MGLKSTWWIADESESKCPFCKDDKGCEKCDPDFVSHSAEMMAHPYVHNPVNGVKRIK